MDRRGFLKRFGVVGAGAVVAPAILISVPKPILVEPTVTPLYNELLVMKARARGRSYMMQTGRHGYEQFHKTMQDYVKHNY